MSFIRASYKIVDAIVNGTAGNFRCLHRARDAFPLSMRLLSTSIIHSTRFSRVGLSTAMQKGYHPTILCETRG